MTEHEGNSSISRRLAHGNTSLDKVLSNTRESKERLAHEYRGLVASIAARYQGKGLSFQDLTQVHIYLCSTNNSNQMHIFVSDTDTLITFNYLFSKIIIDVDVFASVSRPCQNMYFLDIYIFLDFALW